MKWGGPVFAAVCLLLSTSASAGEGGHLSAGKRAIASGGRSPGVEVPIDQLIEMVSSPSGMEKTILPQLPTDADFGDVIRYFSGGRLVSEFGAKESPAPTACSACLYQDYDDCRDRKTPTECRARPPGKDGAPPSECAWDTSASPECVSRFKRDCHRHCLSEFNDKTGLCLVSDRRRWDSAMEALRRRGCPQDPDKTTVIMDGHGQWSSTLAQRIQKCALYFGSCSLHSGGCGDGLDSIALKDALDWVGASCPGTKMRVLANQCTTSGDYTDKASYEANGYTKFELTPSKGCLVQFPPCNANGACPVEQSRYCTDPTGGIRCQTCKREDSPANVPAWRDTNVSACEQYTGIRVPTAQYSHGLRTPMHRYQCPTNCSLLTGDGKRIEKAGVTFDIFDPSPDWAKHGFLKHSYSQLVAIAQKTCAEQFVNDGKLRRTHAYAQEVRANVRAAPKLTACERREEPGDDQPAGDELALMTRYTPPEPPKYKSTAPPEHQALTGFLNANFGGRSAASVGKMWSTERFKTGGHYRKRLTELARAVAIGTFGVPQGVASFEVTQVALSQDGVSYLITYQTTSPGPEDRSDHFPTATLVVPAASDGISLAVPAPTRQPEPPRLFAVPEPPLPVEETPGRGGASIRSSRD